MGDSITAPYIGTPKGSAGDLNWVEQFQMLRSPDDVTIDNVARDGATSTSLLTTGQHTRVANLVANGEVDSAFLMIGANDVTANITSILAGHPDQFVNTVVANITTAVDTVTNAGPVALVVANIPDIGVTPLVRQLLQNNPVYLQRLTDAIGQADQQIEAVAAAYQVPVVDLFNLSYLTLQPLEIGGAEVTNFFAPDHYHPGTVAQGAIANTFLDALNIAYGTDVSALSLSDQEILTLAGIDHPPGESYIDLSGYVIFNGGNHPAAGRGAKFSQVLAAAEPTFAVISLLSLAENQEPALSAPVPRMIAETLAEANQVEPSHVLPALHHQPSATNPALDALFADAAAAFALARGSATL
jgi:lysophospholipase L1-like esterase